MNTIPLSNTDLALAALLVILDAVLSLVLRLKLERQILIALVRMCVQLTLVGWC
jgi:putative ABC transport system permease protein